MSGKEPSGSNASGSSAPPLGHRKTPKNRNSTRKRTAKQNVKVVPVPKKEDKVTKNKDAEAAAKTTAADEKIEDMPEQQASDDKKPKNLEMSCAPEEVVIPAKDDNEPIEDIKSAPEEVVKQTEDAEEPAGTIENPLPEDSKGTIGPDNEPTCVAETEEQDITAKDLIEEKPKAADKASNDENKTAGKSAKKNKKRNRKAQQKKRALDLGLIGSNNPAVQASGADEPNASASGADKPAVVDTAANESTASSSQAQEPTTSGNEQTACGSTPRHMLLDQYDDDGDDDDFDPDDRNNEEQDWDVQDGMWEHYE